MTPSQLIHLARVAGLKGAYKNIYGDVVRLHTREPYNPHTPEGAAQLRDLWLSLNNDHREIVWMKWHMKFGEKSKPDNSRFATWLFTHPEEACQIIFEVTGGEEK